MVVVVVVVVAVVIDQYIFHMTVCLSVRQRGIEFVKLSPTVTQQLFFKKVASF